MKTFNALGVSRRLVASYILDWIVVLAIAGVGLAFDTIGPNKRPFSLINQEIALPYTKEKVSTGILFVVALAAPAVLVFLTCLFVVPGTAAARDTPRGVIWRRKLWEWNVGWLGLALSLALTFMVTDGMKNLFGKPRPDLLSRCDPDFSNLTNSTVGGYSGQLLDDVLLVSWTICKTRGAKLDDGFKSFPSGHASASFAGLTYLTLFLCSKFAITVPFLAPREFGREKATDVFGRRQKQGVSRSDDTEFQEARPIRNQAAAPPVYLLILVLIPIGAAIYVSSTRYSDFRHHGFDIIFGALIGLSAAWFSFRWFHLPIRRGAGWAWGPRSRDRAFGVGMGVGSYVGDEGWGRASTSIRNDDIEIAQPAPQEEITGARP